MSSSLSCGTALPRPTPRIMAARTSGARRRSPQLSERKSSVRKRALSAVQGARSRGGKDARIALIVPWVVAGGAAGSQFGRSHEVNWDETLDEEGGFADVSACELDIGVVECLVCAV